MPRRRDASIISSAKSRQEPAAEFQRLLRRLRAFLVARDVEERLADVLVHRDQHVARAGRAVGAQELACPRRQGAARIVVVGPQVLFEVEALVEAVREREDLGARRQRQLEVVRVRMLDREAADDLQLGGRFGRLHQRDRIRVRIEDQPHVRVRAHLQIGREHALVVAVARAKDDAVLAEGHRLLITVNRRVDDLVGDRCHWVRLSTAPPRT